MDMQYIVQSCDGSSNVSLLGFQNSLSKKKCIESIRAEIDYRNAQTMIVQQHSWNENL
jgi:hypothetical protein